MRDSKGSKETCEWEWIFAILTVLITLQVHTDARTYQIVYYKYTLLYVSYTTTSC